MILKEKLDHIPSSIQQLSTVEQSYFCLFSLKRANLEFEIKLLLEQLVKIISEASQQDLMWMFNKFIDLDIDKPGVLNAFIETGQNEIITSIVSKYRHFSDLELISFCDKSNIKQIYRFAAKRNVISDFLIDYLLSKKDKQTMQLLLDNQNIRLSVDAIEEIAEFIPSASSIISKFSDKETKALNDRKNNRTIYFFTNPNKSLTSFHFNFDPSEISKSKRVINNLFEKNNLHEFYLMSALGKGDLWSFIYGISLLTDSPFKMAEEICTNFFTQHELVDLLECAKFSVNNIKITQLILKLIAKASISYSLDSHSFKSLMLHQLDLEKEIPESLHHVAQYLINLGHN